MNWRSRRLSIAAMAAVMLWYAAVREGHAARPALPDFPTLAPLKATDSILVVSPHPDDESLCCGGLLDAARRTGARIAVVWITNGDGFRWDAMVVEHKLRPRGGAFRELAQLRIAEARAAAGALGITRDAQFFLGYPDGGILALVLDHYYYETPWRSRYTGENAVAYPGALDPGAIFNGRDLERDLAAVVRHVEPTLVFAPSPQDTHPDHRGTGILAARVLAARGQADRMRYWLVHGGRDWPRPRLAYRPAEPLTVAPRGQGMPWQKFDLDAAASAAKFNAIEQHVTQRKVMGRVMRSYVRATELYSLEPVPPQSRCQTAEPCEADAAPASEGAAL